MKTRGVRLTKWKEKKSQRVPLNICIVEEDMRPLFNEITKSKNWNDTLFIVIATLPFTILILWGLYEIFFNWFT